jgi:hypothetical protein
MPSVLKIDRLLGVEWRTVGFYSPEVKAGITVVSVLPPQLNYFLHPNEEEMAVIKGAASTTIRATMMFGTEVGYLEQLVDAVGHDNWEVISEKALHVRQYLDDYSPKYYHPEAHFFNNVARSLGNQLSKMHGGRA